MGFQKVDRVERKHKFGKHDRLTIDGATYRVLSSKSGRHVLQLVVADVVQNHQIVKSDAEINDSLRKRRFKVDEDHYSLALARLKMEYDTTDLTDFDETDLRTMLWKKQWCVRFNCVRAGLDCGEKPRMNPKEIAEFIKQNKHEMEALYIGEFGERRPMGRKQRDGSIKPFDYPSASTLRDWLEASKRHKGRVSAFIPQYAKCGNRHQLDPRALEIVERRVGQYASNLKPAKGDIYDDVLTDLEEVNRGKPEDEWVTVGQTAVLRRINRLEPFIVMAGREGVDRAMREFTPVGYGHRVTEILLRVEMDDWEMDIHNLVASSTYWKSLTPKQRKLVPRVRCTATVAIDVASRAIVGFNLTENAPSTLGSKGALRSMLVDKSAAVEWAGAKSTWHMCGRPFELVNDGGSAFQGDFTISVTRCAIQHVIPEKDPRMRGTIESFFRMFKRLCRYFAGQAFSNVVQKGDYDAESMASITVDEMHRLAIRFIVDFYHRRPHRGLERRAPFDVWNELEDQQERSSIFTETQVISSFGVRGRAALDKHGILYMGNSYQGAGPEDADMLAALHRINPEREVDIVVDPHDLKTILVCVPHRLRGHRELGSDDFIPAECLETSVHGRTLHDLLAADANVRALAKREEAAGRTFRLGAIRHFRDTAEIARQRANLPSFIFTQNDYDRAVEAMKLKSRAALQPVKHGASTVEEGPLGLLIATPNRTRPAAAAPESTEPETIARPADQRHEIAKPDDAASAGQTPLAAPNAPMRPRKSGFFGNSINTFGEDDDR